METVLEAPRTALNASDLIAEAEAMIPFLREKSQETNALRRPPEAVRQRMKDAGVARLWQPKRYGGAEGSLTEGADILRAFGRGCGSTAWIMAQNIQHNLMLANWSERAQDEIWGAMPDALVSGILIPGIGKAVKVDGGFALSGRWPFVSGCEIADWIIFTGDCVVDGKPKEFHFVLPKDQVTILDTWYTIGLRGSSSQDCQLKDIFVPDHRVVSMHDLKGYGDSPGAEVNKSWQFRVPLYALFGCYIGCAALGIAEAAVESYIGNARQRASTMSGSNISAYTTQQVKVAEAQAAVMAARQIIYSTLEQAEALFRSGRSSTVEDRTRWRAMATYAGKLASSAVNLVLDAGGGGVIYERNPLSRAVSDITVANRHITQNWDVNASTYGRVLLGLPCGVEALDD
ncbi:acyl-CoA dehydrogenase family protein [Variovorax paradoxus]|uniref:acyl-CoA dehydrogenase family protein n=1 Tax=Variovorax paradoxus TaxID=34073 RepID=UPI0019344FC8|nr:acyl-CoA dehydrogenase family protein [Variovorax paradoxus]